MKKHKSRATWLTIDLPDNGLNYEEVGDSEQESQVDYVTGGDNIGDQNDMQFERNYPKALRLDKDTIRSFFWDCTDWSGIIETSATVPVRRLPPYGKLTLVPTAIGPPSLTAARRGSSRCSKRACHREAGTGRARRRHTQRRGPRTSGAGRCCGIRHRRHRRHYRRSRRRRHHRHSDGEPLCSWGSERGGL